MKDSGNGQWVDEKTQLLTLERAKTGGMIEHMIALSSNPITIICFKRSDGSYEALIGGGKVGVGGCSQFGAKEAIRQAYRAFLATNEGPRA
jgi:hypothetical protein